MNEQARGELAPARSNNLSNDQKIEVVFDEGKRADVAERTKEAEEYLAGFEDFTIENEADLEVAVDCLKDVKKTYKEIKAEQELVTKPMNAALVKVRSWFKPALEVLERTERLLKGKVAGYHEMVAEESRKAMEAAAKASQEGNFDAAHEAAKGIVSAPRTHGVSVGARQWDYELVDLSLVPREFLTLDHSAVKIHIKRSGGDEPAEIPGLVFVAKAGTVTVRAS